MKPRSPLIALILSVSAFAATYPTQEFPSLVPGPVALKTKPSPRIFRVKLDDLRPSQLGVGPREVELRRKELAARSPEEKKNYLEKKVASLVVAPKGALYLVDGHHLAAALQAAGETTVLARVRDNLYWDDRPTFMKEMVEKKYAILRNTQDNHQIRFDQLPQKIADLKHDDYRDLVWSLRREGDVAEGSPDRDDFGEFVWAKFLRDRIQIEELSEKGYAHALARAKKLAHDPSARLLPGYRKTKKPRLGKSEPGL